MVTRIQVLLTIAGFDPSSGAGVTADLKVFAAHGIFGCAAITALTVQSTQGVRSTEATRPELLEQTLRCLEDDLPPDAIKIGMLSTAGNVEVVASFLGKRRKAGWAGPVVLDPVLRASSGMALLEARGVSMLREYLLPWVDWATPNQSELGVLQDIQISTATQAEAAARRLQAEFPRLNVIMTGGDLAEPNDLVTLPGETRWLKGERIVSRATHGTGCAFSSALLCGLAGGLTGFAAAAAAKRYVEQAIRQAQPIGKGNGPMNLLWPLRKAETA